MAIKNIFVIGAGVMGNGIAQVSAEAGYNVTMMDIKEEFLSKGLATIEKSLDRMIKKGLLEREKYHGIYLYKPLISRPAGLARMVRFFADRVLETDVGSVVSIFAKSNTLSAEEIEELEQLLEEEVV